MNKKDIILSAAIKVFQKKGFEKTKVSDIVKAAGIAQGTFYLYFPSKLELMPHIAEYMVNKMVDEITKTVDLELPCQKQLEQIIDSVFKITHEYHDISAFIYTGITQSEHLKEWEGIYSQFYKWMTGFLQSNTASGQIRNTINPERTSKILIGAIEMAADQLFLYDYPKEENIKEQKNELLNFLHHALGTVIDPEP